MRDYLVVLSQMAGYFILTVGMLLDAVVFVFWPLILGIGLACWVDNGIWVLASFLPLLVWYRVASGLNLSLRGFLFRLCAAVQEKVEARRTVRRTTEEQAGGLTEVDDA